MVSPRAGDQGTIGSHSVWRYYLEQFSHDKKILNVRDKTTGNKFPLSLKSVSVCNDIYKLKQRISPNDVFFLKSLASQSRPLEPQEHKIIDEIVGFLNNDPQPFFRHSNALTELIKTKIAEHVDEDALMRNQEELFTYYENNFIEVFKQLLNQNASFYNDILEDENTQQGFISCIHLKISNFLHLKFFDLICRVSEEMGIGSTQISIDRENLKNNVRMMESHFAQVYPFSSEKYFRTYYFVTFLLTQYFRTQRNQNLYKQLEDNTKNNFPQFQGHFNFDNIMALTAR